jgi:enterochelin esterase family protein
MIRSLGLALLAALPAWAQAPLPDTLVSPEVHPDRRVTFRIRAPKAAEVTFFGDWMPAGKQERMAKDAAGVWSLTVGPLEPSIYLYTFSVDGVTIADPVNPRIKLRSRTSASMVEVPAAPPALWQARDVPHGAVEINWQKSKVLGGETRWIWVYTPPGYEKQRSRRYPVLYLFHGSNDIAGGWVLAGCANFILDNLLAEKRAVPMIVVMPYGHAVPFGSPREAQAKNTALFEEYLLKDVLPLVEAKYRVAAGRRMRAIAGLSMGGGQSLSIGLGHLELFSAIGAFSAAAPADLETRFAKVLEDSALTNARLSVFWIGCGREDSLFERSQKLAALLAARGVRHTFRSSDGAHTYTVWRQYLGEFAPLLFR